MKYFSVFFIVFPFFAHAMDDKKQIVSFDPPEKCFTLTSALSHCFDDCLDEIGPVSKSKKLKQRMQDFENEITINFNQPDLDFTFFEQKKECYLTTRACFGKTACWCSCTSFVLCMTALSMYLRLGLP